MGTLVRADHLVLEAVVEFPLVRSEHDPFDEALVALVAFVELIHEYVGLMSIVRSLRRISTETSSTFEWLEAIQILSSVRFMNCSRMDLQLVFASKFFPTSAALIRH